MFYFLRTVRINEGSMLRKALAELASAVTSFGYIFKFKVVKTSSAGGQITSVHTFWWGKIIGILEQGFTNPGPHFAAATKFCVDPHNGNFFLSPL